MILAAALFALAIGPEVPLSAPAIDAAAGDQTKPSLAWYGDSLAAAWIDDRDTDLPGVRIAQLDALGHPKGFATRVYGSITDVRLAANGKATPLIAITYAGPTFVGPAGTSGRDVSGALGDLVTDGSTYLLVTHDKTIHAEVLDSFGEMNAVADFGRPALDLVAVPFGGAYHVIYLQTDCFVGCSTSIYDTIVQTDGTTSTQLIVNSLRPGTSYASATAGDRLLIAWTTSQGIELMTLTTSRTLLTHTFIGGGAQAHVFAGSDGNEFLVAWQDGRSLQAIRANLDGVAIDRQFTLGSEHAFDLTFARTPLGVVLAWTDGERRDVFTRGAANFAGIAAAPTTLASIGYTQQDSLSMRGMPVWVEGENSSRIASAAGTIAVAAAGHTVIHPVAARGAGSALVAWRDYDEATGHSKVVARFNDETPIVLGEDGRLSADLDVVFDGANFFLFWSNGNLYRTRFTTGGALLETTMLAAGQISTVSAMRIGDKTAAAWIDGSTLVYEGRPVATVRQPARPQLASDDGDQPFLAWTENRCVMTAHRVDDALFVAQPLFCSDHTLSESAAVAWDGTEFVIAWSDRFTGRSRNVHYLRVQRNGAALDPLPLDVTQNSDLYGPSLVPSPAGVTLGYSRVASEEPFDVVSRVFTRTIERLGPTPRERAIGR
jgi:hypothetical protein